MNLSYYSLPQLNNFNKLFQIGFLIPTSKLKKDYDLNSKYLKAYYELMHKYSQPNRTYHSLSHIDLLGELVFRWSEFTGNVITPELCLGILYHDTVYLPGEDSNEEESIKFFYRHAKLFNSGSLNSVVSSLIKSTKVSSNENSRLRDFDYLILAATPEHYNQYAKDLCNEYLSFDISLEVYCEGRLTFLQSLLKKDELFKEIKSAEFAVDLGFSLDTEAGARENISREIETLKQKGTIMTS